MSNNNAQPPEPPANEDIKQLLTDAINHNREAAAQIPTVIELKELSKDVGHHNLYIKGLGGLLLAIIAGCLIAYMRLDDKISDETRHLNTRIDSVIQATSLDVPNNK